MGFLTFSKLSHPKKGFFDSKTGFFDSKTGFFDPKAGFFDPKTGNYFQTFFQTLFAKFLWVQKTGYFHKISELRKTNFSETSENKKFRNFCLTQGLTLKYHSSPGFSFAFVPKNIPICLLYFLSYYLHQWFSTLKVLQPTTHFGCLRSKF